MWKHTASESKQVCCCFVFSNLQPITDSRGHAHDLAHLEEPANQRAQTEHALWFNFTKDTIANINFMLRPFSKSICVKCTMNNIPNYSLILSCLTTNARSEFLVKIVSWCISWCILLFIITVLCLEARTFGDSLSPPSGLFRLHWDNFTFFGLTCIVIVKSSSVWDYKYYWCSMKERNVLGERWHLQFKFSTILSEIWQQTITNGSRKSVQTLVSCG